MINRFRELLPYAEVPIKLLIRPRGTGALIARGTCFTKVKCTSAAQAGQLKSATTPVVLPSPETSLHTSTHPQTGSSRE